MNAPAGESRGGGDPPAAAIVLARGGSKGLPSKNALPVAGRPCLAWTIADALASELVSEVAVSTEDTELLEIAEAWGQGRVRALRRPDSLAADDTPVDDAARQALDALETETGREFGHVVLLYGNAPVRPAGLIDRALRLLVEHCADSVQSYAPVGKHHPWWTARLDTDDGRVSPWEGRVLNHGVFRRQELPPAYIPDGGVLAVRRAALRLEIEGVEPGPHAFFGLDRRGVVTGEGEVVDIDSRIDLLVADALLRERAQ